MSPKYDFDKVVDRTATESLKWVYPRKVLKVEDAIPMWVADMDFEAPPAVVEALRKRAEHGVFGYPLVPPSFWRSAIDWLKRRHGWDVEKKWMVMTPGVVPALNYAVRAFTRPGDPVIIQTPVYHPFYYAVENNGRRVVRNPLRYDGRRYTMDLDDLRTKIDVPGRMLILCSPHNPVGRVWSREELEALSRIAVERDLVIVSDEIHHDLVYPGRRHHVLASLSPELAQQTITCIAPSKTFNTPGLSTAVAITPNPDLRAKFHDEVERAGFELGQVFGIVGFEAAYAHGEDWLDELLPYLEANIDFMARFLEERVPEIRLVRPEGTCLALLDCRDLAEKLGARPRPSPDVPAPVSATLTPPEATVPTAPAESAATGSSAGPKTPVCPPAACPSGSPSESAAVSVNEFFLREARVYFSDGTLFGGELEGFVRINFGCPRSVLAEALERIARAVQREADSWKRPSEALRSDSKQRF